MPSISIQWKWVHLNKKRNKTNQSLKKKKKEESKARRRASTPSHMHHARLSLETRTRRGGEIKLFCRRRAVILRHLNKCARARMFLVREKSPGLDRQRDRNASLVCPCSPFTPFSLAGSLRVSFSNIAVCPFSSFRREVGKLNHLWIVLFVYMGGGVSAGIKSLYYYSKNVLAIVWQ